MLDELEKIDLIRARTGISMREAKGFLDAAGGDVVQALLMVEETDETLLKRHGQQKQHKHQEQGEYQEYQEQPGGCCGQDVLDQVKSAIRRGHKTRIKVKKGDESVLELPASAGVVGLLAALASSELAVLGALGAVTAMAKKYTLEFEHQNGENSPKESKDIEYN